MATGAIAPPRLANVFMHPVTVPADSRPMSRQTAHAELMLKSATPAAAAISSAPAIALLHPAPPARNTPPPTRAPDAPPHHPTHNPYPPPQKPAQPPPPILAIAPQKSTTDANKLASAVENPRASRRYVWSQV